MSIIKIITGFLLAWVAMDVFITPYIKRFIRAYRDDKKERIISGWMDSRETQEKLKESGVTSLHLIKNGKEIKHINLFQNPPK